MKIVKCKHANYHRGLITCKANGQIISFRRTCYVEEHIKCIYYLQKEKEK